MNGLFGRSIGELQVTGRLIGELQVKGSLTGQQRLVESEQIIRLIRNLNLLKVNGLTISYHRFDASL